MTVVCMSLVQVHPTVESCERSNVLLGWVTGRSAMNGCNTSPTEVAQTRTAACTTEVLLRHSLKHPYCTLTSNKYDDCAG